MTAQNIHPVLKYVVITIRIVGVVFVIGLILQGWFKHPIEAMFGCDLNAPLFTQSHQWSIVDSDVSAQIIWQVFQNPSDSFLPSGFPSTGMPVSHGVLLYSQSAGAESCDTQPIVVAVDTSTGQELWRWRSDQITSHLFAVENGFVFTNVSLATKLDFQGNILWEQNDYITVPFRDFTTLTELDDILFFPTDVGLVQLSTDTGEFIGRRSSYADVFTMFNQTALEYVSDTELQMIDTAHNNTPLYTLTFPTQYAPVHRRYPFAVHFEDYLLLYFTTRRVEVRNFDTGALIWDLEQPMYGTPALLGDFIVTFSTPNQIEIRSLETGEIRGSVTLTRESEPTAADDLELATAPNLIWIATDGNDMIFVRQLETFELLAVQIDMAALEQ